MADISEEELADECSTFDITLDNPDVTDRVLELCRQFKLSASDIVMEWVAFKATKKNMVSLNMDGLDHFERERLARKVVKVAKTPKSQKVAPVIYNVETLEDGLDDEAADKLFDAYSTPSAKTQVKRQHTPENPQNHKRVAALGRSPITAAPFSPASLSPASATPSKKYGSRTNAKEVVTRFGSTDDVRWRGSGQSCRIKPYDNSLTKRFKYMFQKLTDQADVLNDMIEDMARCLQTHYGIDELAHVLLPAQETVTVLGRVCCDSNGKLNDKSVVLEGSRETSAGKLIPVNLSALPSYSLFPGQIIAMDGTNQTGSEFLASKVYDGVCLPPPNVTVDRDDFFTVVVAAGPFTTSDNLLYEPLADLVKTIQLDKPDVCILMGPFLDVKHPEIENIVDLTYEDQFNKTLSHLVKAFSNVPTQLVVVPSQRDVHHENVYPQPPFVCGKLQEEKLHLVSDPCTLKINDIVFGITSTDVLLHLGAEEISRAPGLADRLSRLTKHILTQHSYYPLYPHAEELSVDYEHWEQYSRMSATPHILLIPSDLLYFIKDVSGCCCVNPGKLAKGQVGGTYARLVISPAPDKQFHVGNIAGQVLRI